MKKIPLILIVFFGYTSGYGQNLKPDVIATSGRIAKKIGISSRKTKNQLS
jgi:hypothetical protein